MTPHRLILLVALLAAAPLVLLGQEAAPAAAAGGESLLSKLANPTMGFLLICSFLVVWFTGDGLTRTGRSRLIPADHLEALRNHFRAGDYAGAHAYTAAHPQALTNVVRAGLTHAAEGREAAEEAMHTQVVRENSSFQNRIAYLSVIGVIAPMIGLAGTVFGMIDAFASLGQAGAADPSRLSSAIGKVLYATAGGLVVAIPAFVCYYLLRNRTSQALQALQAEVGQLFRRFPYEHFHGVEFAGSEVYAAVPVWTGTAGPAAAQPAPGA